MMSWYSDAREIVSEYLSEVKTAIIWIDLNGRRVRVL